MDNEKIRAEFEAWAVVNFKEIGRFSVIDRDPEFPEFYRISRVEASWVAWQASRAAIVVQLPQIVGYEAGYDSLRDNDFAALPDELFDADEVFALHRSIEVTEAIEAAGLKVKP